MTRKLQIVMAVTVIVLLTLFSGCKTIGNGGSDDSTEVADTAAPIISALPIEIKIGENPDFLKDVSATDSGVPVKVTVDTSAVNMRECGEYPVVYSAVGRNGCVATKVVMLRIKDPRKKIIYLTFDDGPSPATGRILAILKEKGVHATFFVTAQDPYSFKYLKQAHDEGNAVALHTYSHKFRIYTSFETYFEDLEKIQEVVKKYTGEESHIIRFPGGSSNTAFCKYNSDPEFMMKLCREVQERGYQYVDWNSDSHDASTIHPLREKVLANACNSRGNELCLLMHDTPAKQGTIEALPAIIDCYKARGYEFRTLTSTAYICHHGIGPKTRTKKEKKDSVSVAKSHGTATANTHTDAAPANTNTEPQVSEAPAHKESEGGE